MKLITPELEELFKNFPLYSQEKKDDPLVVAKLFDPCGSATWLLLEYDPAQALAFGFTMGLGSDELGYISLTELESIKRPYGLTIERDLYFKQAPLSKFKKRNS